MLLVALTGNYGMGKTSTLRMFASLSAFTINADTIVRGLLEKDNVVKKLKSLLGDKVFDIHGRLIKEKVSDMIFKSRSIGIRHAVEDILHPFVFKEIALLTKAKKGIAIVEAPVVFERGYEKRFHKVIVVYIEKETALKRLELSGINRKSAIKRLSCQMPIEEKIKRADFVIDNSGTPDKTRIQVKDIYKELKLLKEGIN